MEQQRAWLRAIVNSPWQTGRSGQPRGVNTSTFGVDTMILLRGSHHYFAWSPSHPAWTPSTTPARTPASQARGYGVFHMGRSPGALGWRKRWSERCDETGPCQQPAIRSRCFLTLLSVHEWPRLFLDSGSDRACMCVLPARGEGTWEMVTSGISFWACHAMPCHAMPAVVPVLYLTRLHYLACCCRPVLPPPVLFCPVLSCCVSSSLVESNLQSSQTRTHTSSSFSSFLCTF
jgi:hypothetical protein